MHTSNIRQSVAAIYTEWYLDRLERPRHETGLSEDFEELISRPNAPIAMFRTFDVDGCQSLQTFASLGDHSRRKKMLHCAYLSNTVLNSAAPAIQLRVKLFLQIVDKQNEIDVYSAALYPSTTLHISFTTYQELQRLRRGIRPIKRIPQDGN